MASKIIDSQIGFSRKFAESGKAVADLLKPPRHNATAPSSIRPRYINVTNSSLDSNVTVDIPSVPYLGDMYASFQLPAADGNYADYVGLNIIKTVKLTHGGSTIHEYDYRSVMSSILSGLSSDQVESILSAAGGTGNTAAGVYIAPIPTFWSRLSHSGKFVFPLAYHLFRGDMQLELTLRTADEIDDAGASTVTLSSMRLHFLEYDTTTDQKRSHNNDRANYVYYSVDWTTDIDNASGATATEIDISGLRGGLTRLCVSSVTDANYDTAQARYVEEEHDQLVVRADGEDLIKYEPQSGESAGHELDFVNLLMGHGTPSTSISTADNLYFDIVGHDESSRHYSGHLNADAINNLTLTVATTAASRTDIVGWRDALFFYDNGQLRKQI